MLRSPMELLRIARSFPAASVFGHTNKKRTLDCLQKTIFRHNELLKQRPAHQDPILSVMLYQRPFQKIPEQSNNVLQAMNRNNRKPKRANKGARPCSRVSRRAKKRAPGNWRR